MVGALPIEINDLVRSFPVGAQLALCMVFGSCYYLPQDEVFDFEASGSNFGVVVLSHKVLVACDPLFSHCCHFIQEVQL